MRIDMPATDAWEKACERYRDGLPFRDANVHVQIYRGYQSAVWEISRSLARLFSHKKTIAIPAQSEPSLVKMAISFSEEGYQVEYLTPEIAASPEEWVKVHQSDLLFVLLPLDDMITGRKFDWTALLGALKDKRVFRLGLSHSEYRMREVQRPGLYDGEILSLTPERCLFVAGERCRVQPSVTPLLVWSDDATDGMSVLKWPESTIAAHREAVLQFEQNLPQGFRPFFDSNQVDRVYDRAVIWHPEIDGLTLASELVRVNIGKSGTGLFADQMDLIESMPKPGCDGDFETTSGCRWLDLRFSDWLMQQGWSSEKIRGTILIDAVQVGAEIKRRLEEVANKILQFQSSN